ncbi:MAG: hypothetical protein V8R55_06915 [Dysosmobacter sp.]
MADFEAAGGLSALLNELTGKLDLTGITVTGKTLGENIQGCVYRIPTPFTPWLSLWTATAA